MVPGFLHKNRGNTGLQLTGYSQRALIAARSWFSSIADPYLDNDMEVDGFHVFDGGLDWINLYALPKSVEVMSEVNGEAGAVNKLWLPKLFIPGDSAAVQAMMEELKNEDLLLLVEEPDNTIPYKLQFGNSRVPAKVRSMKPTSGNIYDGRKGWEIELIATARYHYYPQYGGYVFPQYFLSYIN